MSRLNDKEPRCPGCNRRCSLEDADFEENKAECYCVKCDKSFAVYRFKIYTYDSFASGETHRGRVLQRKYHT